MLALSLYQLGCIDESLALYRTLLEKFESPPDAVWCNLGLMLATAAFEADDASLLMQVRYAAWQSALGLLPVDEPATIAIVIPSYNHARYVERAIRSVLEQSLAPDEIIVIDDGSSDDSVQRIRRALDGVRIAHQFIARENRGAAVTLNEAIERASSQWIAPLNSDDFFSPDRLRSLRHSCARDGIDWGFGNVAVVDEGDRPFARNSGHRSDALYSVHDSIHMSQSLGLSFLRCNPAISTGNLFFRKSLWRRLGGFAPLRYNHDWRFCLEATLVAEPVFVRDVTYHYRWHNSNTISDDPLKPREEASAMMRDAFANAIKSVQPQGAGNPFAPTPIVWGHGFWSMVAASGNISAVSRSELLALLGAIIAPAPKLQPGAAQN